MAMRTNALIGSDDNDDSGGGSGDGKREKYTQKSKRRDKSDLGEDFIAPDAGWAWMVCIAAGISNLTIYPCLQQFGFLFRMRMMEVLMMTSSQVTTIINTNSAISACTGLLNGPMFRRFSFRQVALFGSMIIFTGLSMTAFCESFLSYLISYSLLYGFGMGISVSASSLAINTYFHKRRRRASGFSWTITGLGPIFLPHVVTFLLSEYGVGGTVLIFAAFSLHAFVSGLIYQPVIYHTQTKPNELMAAEEEVKINCTVHRYSRSSVGETHMQRDGIFSSQYLYQDDDEDMPGYEIMEPGTPMLSRANDGWFGSKLSLASTKMRIRAVSSSKEIEAMIKQTGTGHESEKTESFFKPNNFRRERDGMHKKRTSRHNSETLASQYDNANSHTTVNCPCSNVKQIAQTSVLDKEEPAEDAEIHISCFQKIVTFFDLDLLRDFTFVNLVVGLTIINFGELNFSILTPFILNDFGFNTNQTTIAISLLASMDLLVRFLIPFITERIPWDNRIFFLIGVVGIAIGRTFVAFTRSYTGILCCFTWIGICKGIRTIFWPLIIPSAVPLKRLPAASGLQLLITGLFTLAAGPFVGLIRDRYDFSVTLHCLDCMTFLAAISWSLEALVRYLQRNKTNN